MNVEKQPLPPGVTNKDVDLFKDIQKKAAETVSTIQDIDGTSHVNLAGGQSLLSSSTLAMAVQARCPSAIEFGQWHIDTWYSSPFPQEYARYVTNQTFKTTNRMLLIFVVLT